jgi:hypothetical protein
MSKKDAKKGGGSGESDELELLKAKCLAKELELFTIRDKMHRLEERSLLIENHIERLTTTSKEKIGSLNDIISLLNGYNKEGFRVWIYNGKIIVTISNNSFSASNSFSATMGFSFPKDSLLQRVHGF